MSNRIRQLEKKEIIVKNALQIIENMEIRKFPRWTEFINRKINTFVSTIWQLITLGDKETATAMMYKIIELEIIRDNPELVLGVKFISLSDTIKNTSFKYVELVEVYNDINIRADFVVHNPKEKHYPSIEEAVRNHKGCQTFCLEFSPNLKQYNKIVATHYSKALTKDDIFSLISAIMFFCNFSDAEIMITLRNDFGYTKKEVPIAKNLKYVAIVWGFTNPLKQNQATLSIPCEEMPYNKDDGDYHIFFSRGAGVKDVVKYSDDNFIDSKYSNFSDIYSAKFNNIDCYPYEIDNFYAIFA